MSFIVNKSQLLKFRGKSLKALDTILFSVFSPAIWADLKPDDYLFTSSYI